MERSPFGPPRTMRVRAAPTLLALAIGAVAGCSGPDAAKGVASASPSSTVSTTPSTAAVSLFEVPAGTTDGAGYMRGQQSKLDAEARATGKRKTAMIYVGAPWCEPCVRFHDAVKRGELDAALPGVVLFEFDHDRDEAALAAMGCTSKLVPLFALPDGSGNCSAKRTEGGIKGDGAVAFMTPRIRALLE